MRSTAFLYLLCFSCMLAPSAAAEIGEIDYGRRGFYVGLNGIGAADFFGTNLAEAISGNPVDAELDVGAGAGLNARVGYRAFSWLAVEGLYEWVTGFESDFSATQFPPFEAQVGHDFHSVLFNLKLILPRWRMQPYISAGVGGQHATTKGLITRFDRLGEIEEPVDRSGWAFVGRPAVGIDFYVTQSLVLNAELAGSLSVADFSSGGLQPTDAFYLSGGGGFQWRF